LIGNFSGEGFELKSSVLICLKVLIGKDIRLSVLSPKIKIVGWFILDDLQAGVHDLLVFVHWSEGLGNSGVKAHADGLVHRRGSITGWFK
jgi:hypothetical protein